MLDKSKTYTFDSRRIQKGDSFICLPSGDPYIGDALSRGAVDVIHMTRDEFAVQGHHYFDFPTHRICLIGITGTNGKTSVSYFTQQLLTALGANVLVIGTINSPLTTPESWDILAKINHHIDQGGTHVVLEVSSHGIDQNRVAGFDFNVKCLTNITHDHLDYHKTFENYKQTKMRFMTDYPGHAIYPDDHIAVSPHDIPQLRGAFHRKNVGAALAICQSIGWSLDTLRPQLSQLISPPGRFQTIKLGQPFSVIVDFAHTPDALAAVLEDATSLKAHQHAALRVVFGCGGDRDRDKRPKMGQVAHAFADVIYITADNSRSESTADIMADIAQGITDSSVPCHMIPDRYDALSTAIHDANHGDVVVIAGKGHETNQIQRTFMYHFSDTDVATSIIIRQRKYQFGESWVVDTPDDTADVIFLTHSVAASFNPKKIMPFQRVLPFPTKKKVTELWSKMSRDTIVIFEKRHRLSIYDILLTITNGYNTGVSGVIFGCQQTLAQDLAGLTLMTHSAGPVVIAINPEGYSSLTSLVSILAPTHIILGDLYHPNQYIAPSIQKKIHHMVAALPSDSMVWCHAGMVDIRDAMPDHVAHIQFVESPTWVDYVQSVIHNQLPHPSHLTPSGAQALFYGCLMAMRWYEKRTFLSINHHDYVMQWTDDDLDTIQKIEFFKKNGGAIRHCIPPQPNADTVYHRIQDQADRYQDAIIGPDEWETRLSSTSPNTIDLIWRMQSAQGNGLESLV